jgi:hypothetical protein
MAGTPPSENTPEMSEAFSSADVGGIPEEGSYGEPKEWIPETTLQYDQDGSQCSGPGPTATETPFRTSHPGAGENPFEFGPGTTTIWGSPSRSYPSSAIRAILEPLDILCKWENVRVASEKGLPDLSVATSLPDWIDSWGCAIGANSLLSVSFDMLGFEETESSNPIILDSKHGTARLSYLSTSLSISLKF